MDTSYLKDFQASLASIVKALATDALQGQSQAEGERAVDEDVVSQAVLKLGSVPFAVAPVILIALILTSVAAAKAAVAAQFVASESLKTINLLEALSTADRESEVFMA